ncbi:MAG: sugar ABC transporter permease [Peptococcaceae bacterium]|jgi:sn-glycerol 3-phosphate transport system permease protein|nr:sugar ABC transporter permease [Peptococcaceae bacterium]
MRVSRKRDIAPYVFLAPAFLIFALFSYFPFLKTILMSATITNSGGEMKKFVGFRNYLDLFTSAEFVSTLAVTGKFMAMVFVPTLVFGMIMALLTERRNGPVSVLSEVLFSLPMAVASASAAIVWRMVFNPASGVLNYILGTNINWLADKNWALFSVAMVTVWLQVGFTFIFLVTALRGVQPEVKESAMIDGANAWNIFWKIKLPLISPTLFFVVFFNMTLSFQSFGQIRLLTQGGPGTSTTVLVYQLYQEAFMNKRYGSSAAMSVVLFLIMLAVTLFQIRLERKGVFYN